MYSNVYVLTFIFLSLEIVAGCSSFWRQTPSQQEQPSIAPSTPETPSQQEEEQHSKEQPEDRHDLEGTQSFSCSSDNLYHKWYQAYKNDSSQIGDIPPQKGIKKTTFIITVEEFDNNTEIFCVNRNNDTSKAKTNYTLQRRHFKQTVIDKILSLVNIGSKKHINSVIHKTLIEILDFEANETCKENEKPLHYKLLEYNEKQDVSFSCLEHSEHINKTVYIVMGLINTNSNMIETYEANLTNEIFKKKHNGKILCCLYYVVNETAEEKLITRYVGKKTLLLYDDTVQQDTGGEEFSPSNSIDTDSGHPTILIIITSAAAVLFIMLVILVICRKRCREKPESDTKVLYADLDILRQIEPDNLPRPGPEEESPYAQIIGVMKPDTK